MKLKTDCYHYYESQEMNAYVPNCVLETEYGYCPCHECNRYISRKEARKIVMDQWDVT